MKYYRARMDAYDYLSKDGVVPYELLTERERKTRVPYLKDSVFEIVTINKFNTYKCFGVRFQDGYDHNGRWHYDRVTRERYYTCN